jgi:DNA-directed RNA polymerase specialized sigma24 family protein
MPTADAASGSGSSRAGWFATTHWSVVLTARDGSSADAQAALERLCRTYWFPLYAYVRREGYNPDEAKDLTQGFFARLLEKNYLDQVDRQKGRFRSFLLAALRHYLSDERDRASAAKRGGGYTFMSLDDHTSAEERYRLEPVDDMSPDRIFERRWALTVLEQAQKRLREECVAAGKPELYEQLIKTGTAGKNETTYAALGARWGMSESAVKSAAHRLRQRYHVLVRGEVGHTVSNPAELDEEIRHLMAVIGS